MISKKTRLAAWLLSSFLFILFSASIALAADNQIGISNPISSKTLMEFLGKALKELVTIMIPFLFIFYLITGLMFVSARGDPKKLEVAKSMLLYTTIGGAIILGAWALAGMISSTMSLITG